VSDEPPALRERHLRVGRTARYVQLGASPSAAGHLWIACHGYRQLARYFARQVAPLAEVEKTAVLVPEALNRFYLGDPDGLHGAESRVGGTWMTREDRTAEITDYVEYLERLRQHAAGADAKPSLHALGFSQGAATAARWAVLGRERPRTLVLWGALLPSDVEEARHRQRLREIRIVVVAGARDRALSPARAQAAVDGYREGGLTAALRTHPGSHRVDDGLLRELGEEAVTPG
jgi:predicted esterase